MIESATSCLNSTEPKSGLNVLLCSLCKDELLKSRSALCVKSNYKQIRRADMIFKTELYKSLKTFRSVDSGGRGNVQKTDMFLRQRLSHHNVGLSALKNALYKLFLRSDGAEEIISAL